MTLASLNDRPSATNRLMTWVTSGSQSRSLGVLQAGTYVARAHVHVTEGFNSDGSDTLNVGYDTDTDAFITSVDVSTTGIKSITLGSLAGYNATARQVKAYYVNGGSEPTTGKALVILEIFPSPTQP
jgi:hypothetical protein